MGTGIKMDTVSERSGREKLTETFTSGDRITGEGQLVGEVPLNGGVLGKWDGVVGVLLSGASSSSAV